MREERGKRRRGGERETERDNDNENEFSNLNFPDLKGRS